MTSNAASGTRWTTTPGERDDVDAILETLAAVERAMAVSEAMQVALLARLAEIARAQAARVSEPSAYDFPFRSMANEIAAASRLSPRTAHARLQEAEDLVASFRATFAALQNGEITAAHARQIHAEGARLPEDAREQFEEHVVPYAETHTPAQTRRAAKLACEQVAPRSLQERHDDARVRRAVWVRDLDDGMSELGAVLPSPLAHGTHDRLGRMAIAVHDDQKAVARQQTPEPDALAPRTVPQLRADLLADLALTAVPTAHQLHDPAGGALHATRESVQITIPARQLMPNGGSADEAQASDSSHRRQPARDQAGTARLSSLRDAAPILGAHTIIDPASARQLAGDAPGWDRVFTTPEVAATSTGHPAAPASRRPSHAPRRRGHRGRRPSDARPQPCSS